MSGWIQGARGRAKVKQWPLGRRTVDACDGTASLTSRRGAWAAHRGRVRRDCRTQPRRGACAAHRGRARWDCPRPAEVEQ